VKKETNDHSIGEGLDAKHKKNNDHSIGEGLDVNIRKLRVECLYMKGEPEV